MSSANSDIGRTVHTYMRQCIDENEEVLRKRCTTAGKQAVKALRQESRKRSGKYAKGWKSSVESDETGIEVTVHNRVYSLTHLLENDHKIKNQTRRTYGTAKGDKIIARVADRVGRQFVD